MTTATLEAEQTYTLPWQGIGTDVSATTSIEEALHEAHLDWTVSKEPSYRLRKDGTYVQAPGQFFMVRTTDEMVLGNVKAPYVPFQNVEAFQFANLLLKDGAKPVTAMPLRDGRVIALTFQMPKDMLVGGEDRHNLFVVISSSHDGSRAINAMVTPIRVRCMNTLILAGHQATHSWSLHHTGTLQGRIQEATETLQLSYKYGDDFMAQAEKLLGTTISDRKFGTILDEVVPATAKVDETLETIKSLYKSSTHNGYNGTAWGALNAVTEFYDHHRNTRSQEALFYQVTRGKVASIRQDLTNRLLALN